MRNNNYESQYRYSNRYDTKYKAEIQEAIEFILSHDYGQTIEFEKLAKILRYNIEDEKENRKFKSTMGTIKNFLIEYGYILKTISNLGYYILKPKQISGYCYHTYIRRTQNLLEKSDKILTHIHESDLSEIRLQEKNEVVKLNNDIYDSIGTILNESDYEKNKETYTNLND